MIALAAFLGFEAGERRFGVAPQSVAEFPLYAAARGEETVVAPPAGAPFYTLYMDKTWDRDFTAYRVSILNDAQIERFSMSLAPPAPGQAIHILVPAAALSAGRYTLVISGIDDPRGPTQTARYPFTLRIE
jgi:hypothetical protein